MLLSTQQKTVSQLHQEGKTGQLEPHVPYMQRNRLVVNPGAGWNLETLWKSLKVLKMSGEI